jgi:hypothetical protein
MVPKALGKVSKAESLPLPKRYNIVLYLILLTKPV